MTQYTPVTIRRRLKPSSSFASLALRSSKTAYDPDDEMSHVKGDMAQLENHFADVARAIDKVGRNRKRRFPILRCWYVIDRWLRTTRISRSTVR